MSFSIAEFFALSSTLRDFCSLLIKYAPIALWYTYVTAEQRTLFGIVISFGQGYRLWAFWDNKNTLNGGCYVKITADGVGQLGRETEED